MARRSQYPPELRLEDVAAHEAETDRADAEDRVVLLAIEDLVKVLLAAEIERADRRRIRRRFLREGAVDLVVLLLGGKRGRSVQEQELRPVQADAARAAAERDFELIGKLDVRLEHDLASVERDRGGLAGGAQPLLLALQEIGPQLLVRRALGDSRVDDDLALRSVHDDDVAGSDVAAEIVQADDRRDRQRLGDDG